MNPASKCDATDIVGFCFHLDIPFTLHVPVPISLGHMLSFFGNHAIVFKMKYRRSIATVLFTQSGLQCSCHCERMFIRLHCRANKQLTVLLSSDQIALADQLIDQTADEQIGFVVVSLLIAKTVYGKACRNR